MDDLTFLEQLRSHVPATMDAAARDFGRNLAATDGRELRALRKKLAGVVTQASPEAEPFVRALSMVARGFEAEREDETRDATEIAVIRARKHWAAALERMATGSTLPSELATALAIDPPQVTRLMDELEQAGLVARVAAQSDGRLRPCRLTPRGRRLQRRLQSEVSQGNIKDIVEAVVWTFAQLSVVGRASKRDVAADLCVRLGTPVGSRVLDVLIEALEWMDLATVVDESLVADYVRIDRQVDDLLERAADDPDAQLVQWMRKISRDDALVVRTCRDRWDVVVDRQGLKQVLVVRNDDLSYGEQRSLAGGSFGLFYDNPRLLRADQVSQTDLVERASKLYVLGAANTASLADVEVIDASAWAA